MNIEQYKEMIHEEVINPMIEYMEECEECGFTREDVEKCKALLGDYLNALTNMSMPGDDAIMQEVEKVVLALNDLNEDVDYSLIETGEREAICEFIQESAVACGLQDIPDDVTEEWREW